jgi:hypothetical protein
VPGLDLQGATAIAAGFVFLYCLSVVKFVIDKAKNKIIRPKGDNMKQKADVKLLGYSTLESIWTIGTGSLAGALSS